MIRKLCITDKVEYLALLEQLTLVGDFTDAKWFLLFQKLEKNTDLEIYVIVAINDDATSKTCEVNKDEAKEKHDTILAAGTLLMEQKVIHNGATVGHIEDIVVAEKARGIGLGRQIIDYLVQRAKTLGAYKVILDCKEDKVGFYSKLGFRQQGVQMRIDL